MEAIEIQYDVAFLGPERAEKLDAYLPSTQFARPAPAVLWIHGGGWKTGDKGEKRARTICSFLAENGYAAFSINYLLGTRDADDAAASAWPTNFYDCKSALRFLRKEAGRFGIDPERIAVTGGSAGGQLALLVGYTGNAAEMNTGGLYTEQSNQVSCVIDLYGVADVTTRARVFAGTTPEKTAQNVRAASACTYLSKDSPPVLIAHGDNDAIVSVEFSREFVKQLEAIGAVYQYIEIAGAPHTFDFQPEQMDLRPAVLEFFRKYLGWPRR